MFSLHHRTNINRPRSNFYENEHSISKDIVKCCVCDLGEICTVGQ